MAESEVNDLRALKRGSAEAFERLYDRYAGKVYNFVLGLSGGDSYMAGEMVQTTFIRLWETRDRIDTDKSLISYLTTIAKNSLFNHYKRQTVEYLYRETMLRDEVMHDAATEEEIEMISLQRSLYEMIDRLPPGRKRIFLMSRKEELTTREIAEKLGVSVSTVETQLSLAVKFLRSELGKHRDKLLLLAAWLVNIL
ncbi:MAG: RNA polymerase sigma-70 factor [Bacteroidales bacterium]|jgi:RNA polymerase sigma-70 factor (ECF subfamily)|nr:RNA polymerase sigma-70 factor [Bacteroidales bacterium]